MQRILRPRVIGGAATSDTSRTSIAAVTPASRPRATVSRNLPPQSPLFEQISGLRSYWVPTRPTSGGMGTWREGIGSYIRHERELERRMAGRFEDDERPGALTEISDVDGARETRPRAGTGLAGIGQRVGARMLDSLFFAIPLTLIVHTLAHHGTAAYLTAGLVFPYEVGCIALWGQTLGKRIVGIRVAGPDGAVPGWERAARRWLLPCGLGLLINTGALHHMGVVVFLGTVLSYVVFLRAVFVSDRRGFHDLLAGTTVVEAA